MNATMRILLGLLVSVLAGLEVREKPIAGYCGFLCGDLLLLEGIERILPK
jgi:hypothetical protein